MRDIDDVRQALAYEAWADRAQIATIATVPDEAPAAAVAHLRALAMHLLSGTEDWIARLEERPGAFPLDWHMPAPGELEDALALTEASLARFAAGLTEGRLAEDVSYRDARGRPFTNRVRDALLHVLLHGSEHRGQIQQEVARLGGTSRETGYIGYLREGPAWR